MQYIELAYDFILQCICRARLKQHTAVLACLNAGVCVEFV